MSHSTKNSKSILAKALALENIKVIHDPASQTAMFDVANRELVLPVWENVSPEVYDLLVGHEVGHALFTPDIDAGKPADCTDGPWCTVSEDIGGNVHAAYVQGILNIVEDARIERKIKDKYPGLRRDFAIGYREMFDKDFFGTKDKDITKMSFCDRMNLHFKVGVHLMVPFNDEEQAIIDRVTTAQTFDEVCDLTSDIFSFIGGKRQHISDKQKMNAMGSMSTDSKEGDDSNSVGGSSTSTDNENQSSRGQEANSQNNTSNSTNNNGSGSGASMLPSMDTQNNFDEKQKKLVDDKVSMSNYYTLPVVNPKNLILPYKTTHEVLSKHFDTFSSNVGYYTSRASTEKVLANIENKYSRLISNTRPLIGQLIQQFEMKKAADEQKRTTISRSGRLDTDRLCLHKITDDIFMNYANVADGKNHGMVMVIDWSSSMDHSTEDVLTQVVMLSQFCKRMSIPFDVYLFSTQVDILSLYGSGIDVQSQYQKEGSRRCLSKHKHDVPDQNYDDSSYYHDEMHEKFALIHVLSSDMNNNEFNKALRNTFYLGQFVTRPKDIFNNSSDNSVNGRLWADLTLPTFFGQGGTPLDGSILAMMTIVPEFQKKHKVQIVNTIFLTDGATGGSPINTHRSYGNERTFVRSQLNNKEYDISSHHSTTNAMLEIFRDVTGSNTIGFYIHTGYYCEYFETTDNKAETKKLRELGFIEAPRYKSTTAYNYTTCRYETVQKYVNHTYDRLFILPNTSSKALEEGVDDALDNLPSNATFVRVRNTFMKAVGNRTNSRGFINRFADVISKPFNAQIPA